MTYAYQTRARKAKRRAAIDIVSEAYAYHLRARKAKRQATRDNAAIAFMLLAMIYFAARVAVGLIFNI